MVLVVCRMRKIRYEWLLRVSRKSTGKDVSKGGKGKRMKAEKICPPDRCCDTASYRSFDYHCMASKARVLGCVGIVRMVESFPSFVHKPCWSCRHDAFDEKGGIGQDPSSEMGTYEMACIDACF